MPPPPRKPHELKAVQKKNNQAYVYYRRRWWHLGPWDARRDQPSDAAEEKLSKLKAVWRMNPLAGTVRADDPMLMELWADWRASPHAPPDRVDELSRCELALLGNAGEPGPHRRTRVSGFGSPELLAWQDTLCALVKPDGTKRLGRYTVKRYVALVRQCFRWGVAAGRVDQSQAAALDLVPPPPAGSVREPIERGTVSEGEVMDVVTRIRSPAADLVRVMWWTGARPSELCRLTVGMVIRSGVVRSRKKAEVVVDLDRLGVWAAPLGDAHKTAKRGKERVLFFGPRAQEILARRLADRPRTAAVFAKPGGEAYTSKQIRDYVKKACRRLGRATWSPYQIDHAFMSRVMVSFSGDVPGLGVIAAKAARGHSLRGVTERYVGQDLVTAAEVARRCG